MPEILQKLSPHRDLQVYFERPSAIAGLSEATASGFKVSGTWRQQFDWAVVEWNQHNTFEHPFFRSLPDGDLSGLVLSYDEERQNCIPVDSDLFPTVDWPYLRIWTRQGGVDDFFRVALKEHATAIEGSYTAATAELELQGTVTPGDYVGISIFGEHHTYQALGADTLGDIVEAIRASVNAFSATLTATRTGSRLTLAIKDLMAGANGNRLGVYGFVSGAKTESWTPWSAAFSNGTSPTKWHYQIDFSSLVDKDLRTVPTSAIRKMRWTYSAEMQAGQYARSEYLVAVTNWTVTGSNRQYMVASPGSRRIEDDDSLVAYTGSWTPGYGNFSGGTIRHTTTPGDSLTLQYHCANPHRLYLGTRYSFSGAAVQAQVDGGAPITENLFIAGEDALARVPLGDLAAGTHTVTVTHAGGAGSFLYFDFLEIAHPVAELPEIASDPKVTLATDWDTDHSIAVPAERTAWMIHSLGFHGRVNHYVGALWFYELVATGNVYAVGTIGFSGTPVFSETTTITIGRDDEIDTIDLVHINRIGDTAETIAKAFELELNRGYTAIRAVASGPQLTIYSRVMGLDGNKVTIAISPTSGAFHGTASGPKLAGAVEPKWLTDLTASPRINRAVRDWSRAFYVAVKNYGLDVTAAFSLELQHGDTSLAAGIAQRYPSGAAVQLNTPAIQTNFSPESLAFWRDVHLDMATVLVEAGVVPYMQFGEVQWWYFPYDGSGMPFYDAYTAAQFQAAYGQPMAVITANNVDPSLYTNEVAFLPTLIGNFTNAIMSHVRATYPNARFEVLYPTDVNDTAFNRLINYPAAAWTPAILDNLKTESFTYTFSRNLDLARTTIEFGATKGFDRSKRSFLVGPGDSSAPWRKEVEMARSQGLESIVLFALDQFCLIGYPAPLSPMPRRSGFHG